MNGQQKLRNILGRGWAFPMTPVGEHRNLQYLDGPEKVRQSIWLILQTEPGERIMRPSFGCGLRRYLMKPNNSATWSGIKRDIERALNSWEPRIRLQEVKVTGGDEANVALISISYTHVGDGSSENLVFPFYLE